MFTGLIQGQGTLRTLHSHGQDLRLSIESHFPLSALALGESIAVNGACLTVESGDEHSFSAYVSEKSLRSTTLGQLKSGSLVNLERALAVGDRLGGHIVSGHVDTVATVWEVRAAGQSRIITVHFPVQFSPEVITKGSVTLDGISLTVNACAVHDNVGSLEVNVIPETFNVTTVKFWKKGTKINLETDIIGKYVRHMLAPFTGNKGAANAGEDSKSSITMNLLQEHGFL